MLWRLSSHNLHIETGRYSNKPTPKDGRICRYCDSISTYALEDEFHFVMVCLLYSGERNKLLIKIKERYPYIKNLSLENKFIWLMSQEDTNLIQILATTVRPAFQKREIYLTF